MPKPFVVDHVNTSLEGFLDKSLSKSELQIRWVIESVCRKHPWCFYSNRELAEQFNLHPMTVSAAVRSLVKKGAVLSEIEVGSAGTRRRMKLNPEYLKSKNHLVVEYNGKMTKRRIKEDEQPAESIPGGKSEGLPPLSLEAYPPRRKSNHSKQFGSSIYICNNTDVDFLSGNHSKTASSFGSRTPKPPISRKERLPILTVEKEDQMPVSERAIERILNHWNSKGSPLTRHRSGGTSKFRKIRSALQAALRVDSEQDILEAIDLYHRCLTDPTMTLHRYRKMAPTNVGLDEFFKFTPESLNMINVYGIGTLKGAGSWFEIAKKGEKAARDRFGIVPEDKHPIVTSMLKKIVRSLDDRRRVAGNESERILRQASGKLVEFHQRIRPRIISWRKVDAFSPCEFLQTKLGDFMRENLNLERFELYWLLSGRFYRDFERHLEQIGALSREMEPKTRHRYGKPTEKDFATSSCLRHQCTPTACVDDPTIPDHVKVGRPR